MDRWYTILDFPTYQIDADGIVRNRFTGKLLKPMRTRSGSTYVTLRKDGRGFNRGIRTLVRIHVRRF